MAHPPGSVWPAGDNLAGGRKPNVQGLQTRTCDQRTVDGRKHHAVPRPVRERRDGRQPGPDARFRRQDHGEPVRTPGSDVAVGGGAREGHVQAGGPRHRRHHCGRRRGNVVAQHAGRRTALCRDCDLGRDRRLACGCRAQGDRVIVEPYRRVDLGGQARRRHRFDQGFRRQESRLYQPQIDHRDGDPYRAQAGGTDRQGRHSSARRSWAGLDRAGAGRGRGRTVQRSGADHHPEQVQGAVLRPPILSKISPGRLR